MSPDQVEDPRAFKQAFSCNDGQASSTEAPTEPTWAPPESVNEQASRRLRPTAPEMRPHYRACGPCHLKAKSCRSPSPSVRIAFTNIWSPKVGANTLSCATVLIIRRRMGPTFD